MPFILSAMLAVLSLIGSAAIFFGDDGFQRLQTDALPYLSGPVFLRIVAIPLGVAWMTLELVNTISPRSLLSRRRPGIPSRVMLGIWLAAFWMLIQTLGLWLLGPYIPDWGISGLSSLLVTLVLGLCLTRCWSGHCISCGYDLQRTRRGDPCPECGGHSTRHGDSQASVLALSSN